MNAHVSLAFKHYKDTPLIPFAQGVHDDIGAHTTTFNSLPVTLVALLAAVTGFTTKYHDAQKGSVAQTEAKDEARVVLIGLLAQLAAYVEGVAQGNADIIRSAGFDVATHEHSAPVPLAQPEGVTPLNYASTKIQLRMKAQPNVHSVKVQYRTGTGTWQDGGVYPSTKLVIVENLTPGTVYEFRVQFIGGSTGASEWSAVVNLMST